MTDAVTSGATDLIGIARPSEARAYGPRRAVLDALRRDGRNILRRRRGA